MIDPAIESHYGTGYERARLSPDGRPSLEFVRSMELLERLLPAPPARVLDVGGGPGTYAAPLGDARELAEPDASQDAGGRLLGMAVGRFASLLNGQAGVLHLCLLPYLR